MSPTLLVLLGLGLGLAVGLGAEASGSALAAGVIGVLDPLGTLFINGIRMTVIPLVVSSLVAGVASANDPASVGRLGARAVGLFIAVTGAAVVLALAVGPLVLGVIPVSPEAAATLRAAAAPPDGAGALSLRQWLLDLVPVNPVKAAADGAMLPLIVFSILFGAALIPVEAARREALLRGVTAVQEATLTLTRWVLRLAPLGVFALAAALAFKLGAQAAGALVAYVVGVSLATIVFCTAVLYPLAAVLGGVPIARFARAALPAQAVAFSSRSSMAALPAMLEAARGALGLSPRVSGFFIPLAASTFRAGAGIGVPIAVLFTARLYGIELSPTALVTIALTTVVGCFSIPGIPGGSIVATVPILLAVGIPVEGVGVLLGVDTIPDMFRTTTNVTADLAAATIMDRGERGAAGAGAVPGATGGARATPSGDA